MLRDPRRTPGLGQAPPARLPSYTVWAKDLLHWAILSLVMMAQENPGPLIPSNQSQAWPLPSPPPLTTGSQKHWAAGLPQATHFTSLNPVPLLCK